MKTAHRLIASWLVLASFATTTVFASETYSSSPPAPNRVYVTPLEGAPASQQPYRLGDRWCRDVAVEHREHHSRTTGKIVGAIAGGLIGSRFGRGSGRTLATVGGAVAGGAIGDHVQKERNRPDGRITYERRCWTASPEDRVR